MTTNENTRASIVDALFDIGLGWVELGLSQGKAALEGTSRALAKTARSLGAIEEALKSDSRAEDEAA